MGLKCTSCDYMYPHTSSDYYPDPVAVVRHLMKCHKKAQEEIRDLVDMNTVTV